jgi:hypothetical protein
MFYILYHDLHGFPFPCVVSTRLCENKSKTEKPRFSLIRKQVARDLEIFSIFLFLFYFIFLLFSARRQGREGSGVVIVVAGSCASSSGSSFLHLPQAN